MSFIQTGFVVIVSVFMACACQQKKRPSMTGEDPVEVKDFITFFQPVSLPFQVADSVLGKKESDSALISYKIFTQFVPDTVVAKFFSKGAKPRFFAMGKAEVPGAETYLFVKAATSVKKVILLFAFDKKSQFLAALPLLRSDASKTLQRSASLDRKYSITKSQLRRNADGTISEGKDVYVLNEATRDFMLIMTDALEDKVTELINPIDTLPRKHKLSADYTAGKMNLVSIRDGRKNDRLTFFIHFEKNNGDCTGELKGEAIIKPGNIAEYREAGDPCVLQFRFSSSSVTLKEIEGCGSRRGLRCSFDGSFVRKKYVKPSEKKSGTKK